MTKHTEHLNKGGHTSEHRSRRNDRQVCSPTDDGSNSGDRKRSIKPGPAMYPLPVVMVSCGTMEESNILTVAWTGIVNSHPPITYISVRPQRFSHDIIKNNKEFVINLVNDRLVKSADFCGVRSGRNEDKFAECGLTRMEADKVGAPMIAESPVNIECRVRNVVEMPSHDMFLADIIAVHIDERYIDENGRYSYERMGLVAWNHGSYHRLDGRSLGSFGFSVMKPKTAKRKRREKARRRGGHTNSHMNDNR